MKAFSSEQYERLKKFIGLFYEWYMAKPHHSPRSHPLAVLAELESKSAPQARRGLDMAINDCVEMSSEWSPERVAHADRRLSENGAPSLSEIRKSYSKKYFQILKRGRIRSLHEYYFLKGIVDGGSIEPGAGEDERLASMLSSYERLARRGCEK